MSDKPETGRKRGLGMGLSALLGGEDNYSEPKTANDRVDSVPIEFVAPSPLQPRKVFRDEDLEELAASIRARGVIQPLVVRPATSGAPGYEIIAGERRWRAAQRAGLHSLPVVVRELDDLEVLEVALIENLQRENLSPIEEATAYRRLIDEYGHTQEALATALGKSRSHVANMMRLLKLPQAVLDLLAEGRISAGHARALLAAEDPIAMAQEIVARELSVRDTEALVQGQALVKREVAKAAIDRDPDVVACEERLARSLGLKVQIKPKGKGGMIAIRFSSPDQLDSLLERLASGQN